MDKTAHVNASFSSDNERAPQDATAVAHDAIERTAEVAHHAVDRAGPAFDRWIDGVRRRTAAWPLAAPGIALAVGFVLGRIF